MRVPLHMPIEIRRALGDYERWFALSAGISVGRIDLQHPVADELEERVFVTFHLPGDDKPFQCPGRILETPPADEHTSDVQRRSISIELEDLDRERVLAYLELQTFGH